MKMEQDERYAEQVLALVTRDNLSLYSSCSDDYDSYPKGVMVETFDHHRDQEQESILCLNDKYPFFENTIQDWEGKRSHLIFRLFHLLLARTKKRHSIRNLILVIELERKERLEFKQFYFSDMALLKESRSTTAHLYNSLRHYGFRFGFQAVVKSIKKLMLMMN